MSTRTRVAKAGTTSKRSSATPSTTGATKAKSRGAKAVLVKEEPMDTDSDVKPKEVGRTRGRKSATGAPARVPKKSASICEETKVKAKPGPKMKDVFCTCSAGDDGSPMIFCSGCRIWFHFTCEDLSEADAEEISVYICPTCSQTTGRRSALVWHGEDALEEDTDDERTYNQRRKAVLVKTNPSKTPDPLAPVPVQSFKQAESEVVPLQEPSGQTFMEADTDNKENRKAKETRRRSRTHVSESEDESSDAESTTRGRRRLTRMKRKATATPSPGAPSKRATASVSAQATPNGHLKRKASTTTAPTIKAPPPKRKRKASEDATDNPTRKYCLKKLEEIFVEVYLRYPHVRVPNDEGDQSNENQEESKGSGVKLVPKNPDELTEEEKEAVINDAKAFTSEFEGCLYEAMNEPDKTGQPSAGTKYKNHFRMLEFNLKQPDRAPIHKRITSGEMTPQQLAAMDSVDLADEETKQSIKQAEQEALEHSILPTLTAPRAKITHKGLEDIEDVNGHLSTVRELERQEQEEAERRERERQARARAASAQRQRTASISVPPESPTVPSHSPSTENWGAPPPVPAHAMASQSPVDATNLEGTFNMPVDQPQGELNLDDLINIDEDHGGPLTIDTSLAPAAPSAAPVASSPVTTTPTAISPFASQSERSRAPSFDLNSVWGGLKPTTEPPDEGQPLVAEGLTQEPASNDAAGSEEEMELESVEANDQDFDMFLDNPETEAQQPQESNQSADQATQDKASVDSLPEVWIGKITMPLDSSVPPETPLHARQVAGRETLPPDSPLWKVLFPSDILRIEGRVPVDNSIKYLLQTRLNPAKELYAVALSPSPSGEEDFKSYCDFLISRGRHGLLFPWGSRPKESSPGREFYVVPLTATQPLPEFMEMLDNLKLPKERTRTYLIGIWILNRGKLAVHSSPPAPQQTSTSGLTPEIAQSTTPVQPIPSLPFTLPNILLPSSTPSVVPPTTNSPAIPAIPPTLATSLPASIPTIPPVVPQIQPPSTAVPALNTAALAAEVATLTPEQIQNVLRTLVGSGLPGLTPPIPPPGAAPSMGAAQPPPHIPTPPMVSSAPQSWMGPVPPPPPPPPPQAPYPMSFPPLQAHSSYRQAQQPPAPPPPMMNSMPPMPAHSLYDPHATPVPQHQHQHNDYDYDYNDRDYRQHSNSGYQHHDRGDRGDHRGWRGNRGDYGHRGGRGRGRGRGGGGGGHQDYRDDRRHGDQGWPRRRQDNW